MNKNAEKTNMSISKIILITFISIMLVSSLIIGNIVFSNWFDYADKGLTESINRFDKEVYNVLKFYMDNHWSGIEGTTSLNDHLEMIAKGKNSIALVIDRNSGKLIGNSIKMDNYLRFQDGTKKAVRINDMGYPALTNAYNQYLSTNVKSYKLTNIQDTLYINISEYKTIYFDWLVFTAIPNTQFTYAIRRVIIYTMIFSLIALGATFMGYFALIKKLLKPMDYLLDTSKKFADGDLSQRVVVVRNDEIGSLARSFNSMSDTINELVNKLEDKVTERTLELEKANDMMKHKKNELRLILDSTAGAIYGLDNDGNCTFCNASCIEMLGYNHQRELIGKNMHYQIHHSKRDKTLMPINECRIIIAIKEGTRFTAKDEVFWRKDGTCFDVEYSVYPQLKDGEIIGAVVSFMDITESKKAQEQIEYLSFHDPVTGLYNRMFFDNALKRIDNEKNLPISIIYGDVNGLKLINDIYGHAKGDELLKKITKVLTNAFRDGDIVARLGGDEFAILLPNTKSKDAKLIIQRIKNEFSAEDIGGISGSISLASDTKTNIEQEITTTLNNAEADMYKVKSLENRKVNSKMFEDIMSSLYEKGQREKLHSMNVARISEEIAINMNLSETEVKGLKTAGFYHDIGKVILDKNILNKVGKLNREEMEEMERHPLIGYRILSLFDETVNIAETILTHHERWDGTGYPKGLTGEEIPLFARIISVAEGYDAMTNKVGGKGVTHEEAIDEIKSQSGIKFDPLVVNNFLEIINT